MIFYSLELYRFWGSLHSKVNEISQIVKNVLFLYFVVWMNSIVLFASHDSIAYESIEVNIDVVNKVIETSNSLVFCDSVNFQGHDLRYNWAKSGLNIRKSPNLESERVGVIPFGGELEILSDSTKREQSIVINEIFSTENCVRKEGLHLKGYWVKIKYNLIEGFVFDGYISRFPPLRYEVNKEGNRYIEDFDKYLRRNYEVRNIEELRSDDSDYYKILTYYENGIIYESTGSTGWYDRIIVFPDMSINEGLLIFLQLHETEEVKKLPEGARHQIYEQEPTKVEINAYGEAFSFYQHGSILVFTLSGGC